MLTQWFVRGDIDGFFGLFIDNLLQLMVIAVVGKNVCGLPSELIQSRILPGAALSVLVGNLFYAYQARQLARRTGRTDVTALPFGINTPSVIAFLFLIMGPIYQETKDPQQAWNAGLMACFISGVMEVVGAFTGDWLRRHTPRAALLSALSGIAITFIAMGFVFQLFATPILGLLPLMLILIGYGSRSKMMFGLPVGLLAVLVGTAIAWGLRYAGYSYFTPSTETYSFQLNMLHPSIRELFDGLRSPQGWHYLSVILPMGFFTVIGSLQNLESAEAAGDRFETRSSLLANGIGTLAAACFGSPFPTTIYIGHPGWKAMGARSGYSVLNGVLISALCFAGGVSWVLRWLPLEVTLGIVLWVGLIITAQAFQESPKPHALSVALGFIPSLAAWALLLVETALRVAGSSLYQAASKFGDALYIHGAIALSQGFILVSMIFSAILAFSIDRDFRKAACWAIAGAAFSALGLIHAYELTPSGVSNKFGWFAAPQFVFGYLLTAAVLLAMHFTASKKAS